MIGGIIELMRRWESNPQDLSLYFLLKMRWLSLNLAI